MRSEVHDWVPRLADNCRAVRTICLSCIHAFMFQIDYTCCCVTAAAVGVGLHDADGAVRRIVAFATRTGMVVGHLLSMMPLSDWCAAACVVGVV